LARFGTFLPEFGVNFSAKIEGFFDDRTGYLLYLQQTFLQVRAGNN